MITLLFVEQKKMRQNLQNLRRKKAEKDEAAASGGFNANSFDGLPQMGNHPLPPNPCIEGPVVQFMSVPQPPCPMPVQITAPKKVEEHEYAHALYDFIPSQPSELAFTGGDLLKVSLLAFLHTCACRRHVPITPHPPV